MEKLDTLIIKVWRYISEISLTSKLQIPNEKSSRIILKNYVKLFKKYIRRLNFYLPEFYSTLQRDYGFLYIERVYSPIEGSHNLYKIGPYRCFDDGYILGSIKVRTDKTDLKVRILFINEYKRKIQRWKQRIYALRVYSLLALLEKYNDKVPLRYVIGIGTYNYGFGECVLFRRSKGYIMEYILKNNDQNKTCLTVSMYNINEIISKIIKATMRGKSVKKALRNINPIVRYTIEDIE